MVYVLEDDKAILDIVLYALKSQNIEAKGFSNFTQLQVALKEAIPQILVLDCLLPGMNGFEILQRIKSNPNTQKISVLMLTALDSEIDKVKGLDYGADDYMSKPFGVMEFLARIRAILRRKNGDKDEIVFENCIYSITNHQVKINNKPIPLTLKEFELLGLFLKNQERAFNREEILEALWGYDYGTHSRTLDIHIKTLRQKLGDFGHHIQTIRGMGYKFSKD
ncbi:response regulator transcription factor [Helicobacter apodemus]|uniref:DNA-binding response regulator n=1 Tax=Helicobacter apodemus TaxID=135569 RepID=A0A2U8FGQ0_9HELI|nr:response regulator transcription factor [Helicobacter apodemus]AWI34715.1 DNA-binding response regulator [Helicobacter apodemus]